MSSPRVRRLQSDYMRITKRFAGWPLIEVKLADGQPPDRYRIIYNIKGLDASADGQIFERNEHVLEVYLGLEYPRRAPQLRLLTPIFHPNFNNTDVCAQDIYAASEGLDDLIIRIGRMVAYQEYNTKSPLNGYAAKWAEENIHKLPVDPREISPFAKEYFVPEVDVVQPISESWEDQIKIGGQVDVYSHTDENIPVQYKCPECETLMQSHPEQAGEIVQCPSCSASFMVAVSVDQEADRNAVQRYRCPHCAQLIEADASMEGSEVGCPSCQGVIILGG
jgi:predicted Zn finger-like uncharacterized protein